MIDHHGPIWRDAMQTALLMARMHGERYRVRACTIRGCWVAEPSARTEA